MNATAECCGKCSHVGFVWLADPAESRCARCGGKLRQRHKWLGERVIDYAGTIDQIRKQIPQFDRQPLIYNLPAYTMTGSAWQQMPSHVHNRYYDVIIRRPQYPPKEPPVPAGVVSKKYTLVQHTELLNVALAALAVHINTQSLLAGLTLTEYGNRMHFTIILPDDYTYVIGNDDKMALRLERFNFMDGTVPLQVMLGWYRFVCFNGLIVGTTLSRSRQLHTESLSLAEVGNVLNEGFDIAVHDKETFNTWIDDQVTPDQLVQWVDDPLKEKWGVLAAARAYHIAQTGFDGEFLDRFEKALPHARQMKNGRQVPGITASAGNVFEVSQILSWLAKERADIAERRERMAEI